MQRLKYEPLERLQVPRPVERIRYIVDQCRGRQVLDLGGFDETAVSKRGTQHWLHGALAAEAAFVLGVDASSQIPPQGLETGPRSRFVHGDVTALESLDLGGFAPDIVVAGELLEHLPNSLAFLEQLKRLFAGKRLIASTPNATSLANALLGALSRESNHPDHLQIYSYKTLNTLCQRAGLGEWTIIPYHVQFTEMALRNTGWRRQAVRRAQALVQGAEALFPLLCGGVMVDIARL